MIGGALVQTTDRGALMLTTDGGEQLSSWDHLWPLLVTAALSLIVVLVVQLYVVPHVESRKRREDRWEADLRRLGEVLAFDLERAASDYYSALLSAAWLDGRAGEVDSNLDVERLREAVRENRDRLRSASARYREVELQVRWLSDRVVSIAPGLSVMRSFRLAVMGLQVHDFTNADPTYHTHDDTFELTDELVRSVADKQRAAARTLLDQVTALGMGRMPREPSCGRRLIARLRWQLRELSPGRSGAPPSGSP